jgi:hypothetical protein
MHRSSSWLLVLIIAVGLVAIPRTSEAQCTEKCVYLHGEDGGTIGYGCFAGSEGHDCEASISQCAIHTAGCSDTFDEVFLDADGQAIAIARRCSTTGAILRVTDLSKEYEWIDGQTSHETPSAKQSYTTADPRMNNS